MAGSIGSSGLNISSLLSAFTGSSGNTNNVFDLGAAALIGASNTQSTGYFSIEPFLQMAANPLLTTPLTQLSSGDRNSAIGLINQSLNGFGSLPIDALAALLGSEGKRSADDTAKTEDGDKDTAAKTENKDKNGKTEVKDANNKVVTGADAKKDTGSKEEGAENATSAEDKQKEILEKLKSLPVFKLREAQLKGENLTMSRGELAEALGIKDTVENPDEQLELTPEQIKTLVGSQAPAQPSLGSVNAVSGGLSDVFTLLAASGSNGSLQAGGDSMSALLQALGSSGSNGSNPLSSLMGSLSSAQSNPIATLFGGGGTSNPLAGLLGGDNPLAALLGGLG